MKFIPYCRFCAHKRDTYPWTCEAFPGGLPEAVLSGANEHLRAIPGDKGFRFELRPDLQDEYLFTRWRDDNPEEFGERMRSELGQAPRAVSIEEYSRARDAVLRWFIDSKR